MATKAKDAYFEELLGDIARLSDEIKNLPFELDEALDPVHAKFQILLNNLEKAGQSYCETINQATNDHLQRINEGLISTRLEVNYQVRDAFTSVRNELAKEQAESSKAVKNENSLLKLSLLAFFCFEVVQLAFDILSIK